MVFEHVNYRSFLKSVLADRISRNPKYSLRALARQLEVSPTLLSKVNRGEKNLSVQNAQNVSYRLNLSERESEYFCCLVQYELTKSPGLKSKLLSKLNEL